MVAVFGALVAVSAVVAVDDPRLLQLALEYSGAGGEIAAQGESTDYYTQGSAMTVGELRVVTNSAGFAAWLEQRNAPAEVDRVAYTAGWSEAVVDGVSVTWRTHLSPYDKAGDEARKAAAVSVVSSNTVDMRALRFDIATNINDSVTIRTNTAALTFSATPTRAQVQALAAQVQALASELADANRTIRRLRKAVAQEAD